MPSIKEVRQQTQALRGVVMYYKADKVRILRNLFGINGLKINAVVSGNNRHYRVQCVLPNVKVAKPEKPFWKSVGSNNKPVRLSVTDNSQVRMRCTCEDFKYTWSEPLRKNDGLEGSKFDFSEIQGVGKPRNPRKRYGTCKHCYSVLRLLLAK